MRSDAAPLLKSPLSAAASFVASACRLVVTARGEKGGGDGGSGGAVGGGDGGTAWTRVHTSAVQLGTQPLESHTASETTLVSRETQRFVSLLGINGCTVVVEVEASELADDGVDGATSATGADGASASAEDEGAPASLCVPEVSALVGADASPTSFSASPSLPLPASGALGSDAPASLALPSASLAAEGNSESISLAKSTSLVLVCVESTGVDAASGTFCKGGDGGLAGGSGDGGGRTTREPPSHAQHNSVGSADIQRNCVHVSAGAPATSLLKKSQVWLPQLDHWPADCPLFPTECT